MNALEVLQALIRREWPVRLLSPLIGKYNPFHPDFRRDPYPSYRRLRETAPIYKSPPLQSLILSRYQDVAPLLQDPRFGVDRTKARIEEKLGMFDALPSGLGEAVTTSLLMTDAPDHTRLRRLVSRAFTPRVIQRLGDRVGDLVGELLDEMAHKPDPDLIRDLADPLPLLVIAEMLGVPVADRAQLKTWSNSAVGILDPLQAEGGIRNIAEAFDGLSAHLDRVFADRRATPREDLVSALVAVEEQGDVLSEVELKSLCLLILVAGNETTTNLIGNGMLALLHHPDERRRLQDDPSLARTAIEEMLRYDSPIQMTDRVALEPLELGGKRVRKGDVVGVILASANRDPEQFSDPDRLDIGRKDNQHLAFGHGVHFCLGAQLARLEGQTAITRLLERFPDLDGERNPTSWKRSLVLRGLTSLRLDLRATAVG
ncbi:MAG: cytochrome P450 [Candidatus Binatia bacterium]|nr:cytochrome P450 [Candidatus Binatia bacterium]